MGIGTASLRLMVLVGYPRDGLAHHTTTCLDVGSFPGLALSRFPFLCARWIPDARVLQSFDMVPQMCIGSLTRFK
jgi:hypothetical protein